MKSVHTASSSEDLIKAAAAMLVETFDFDQLLIVRVDLADGPTTVTDAASMTLDRRLSAAVARTGHLHPAVVSYLVPGDDRSPRRISDVTELHSWLQSPAYLEPFREHVAKHQLSLVTSLEGAVGHGWILTRTTRDFDDDDVEAAQLILPLLSLIHGLSTSGADGDADDRFSLRERSIVDLLSRGLSARQIANRLGITEPTTRKHLVHIYAKLGVHDRLSAVLAVSGRAHPSRSVPAARAGSPRDVHGQVS